jgi:RNA polymerase-binding protein DksA
VRDREPDDEAAAAVENISRDMLAATLERERRTLREVESALVRMKKGEYGTCDSCGDAIAKARLDALPWARHCINCAEHALNPRSFRMAS